MRSNLVWTAMIAAGVALGVLTWLAWPETGTRLVRLPYGEALPKHTVVVAPAPTRAPARATPVDAPAPPTAAEPAPEPVEEVRVIASAVPDPVRTQAPTPAAYEGPPPVASEAEEDGYVETPEELGAEPLPGEGEPAAEPVDELDEDGDDPSLGVSELPQPGAE